MTKNSDFPANAIIVSAGRSSRMGMAKALLPFDAKHSFIEQIISAYSSLNIQPLIVTNEKLALKLAEPVSRSGGRLADGASEEWTMIDSLRYGLTTLNDLTKPLFIQPVDMPFVTPEILADLLAAAARHPEAFIMPESDLGPGHPLYIPQALVPLIYTRECDHGLHNLLKNKALKSYYLKNSDPRLSCNINTPEDYEQLLKRKL